MRQKSVLAKEENETVDTQMQCRAMRRHLAVVHLRKAARLLAADPEREVILPGWDMEWDETDEETRRAAAAVLAERLSPHECTRVPAGELGSLVGYLADMLE